MTDIITRNEWNARSPRHVSRINTPTPELVLHHSADNNHGAGGVRNIQDFHMDGKGWSDIAYSFLVDKYGYIYEGRGAGVRGAHTANHNTSAHGICLIGNFQHDPPSNSQLDATAELVRLGNQRGWWAGYISHGHRDFSSTSCPGDNLYPLIPSINDAAKKEITLNPDLVIYAPRNIDYLAAAAIAGARGGRAVPVLDAQLAQEAVDNGLRVVAVGGPAADDLEGEVEAVGANAVASLVKGAEAV